MKREHINIETLDPNLLFYAPLKSDLEDKVNKVYGVPFNSNEVYIDSNFGACYVDNIVYSEIYALQFNLQNTQYPSRLNAATEIGISYDVYPYRIGHLTNNERKVAYPIKFGPLNAVYTQSLGIRDRVSNPTGSNTVVVNQWNTMNYTWNLVTKVLYTSNGTYSGTGTRNFTKSGNLNTLGSFQSSGNVNDEFNYQGYIKNLKVWIIS